MPRGRPKKMKKPTSINGESVPQSLAVIDPPRDERDAHISRLEAQLRDFEERFSRRPDSNEPAPAPIVAKPKEPPAPIVLIKEVNARDLFEIEDRKPVTGVFKMGNKKPHEKGMIKIGAMRKYKGDHMRPWIFEHNKTYTIPKWLASWINGGEENPEDLVKSPRCNIVTHNDQDNDLNSKRMLAKPNLHSLFSFTPVAKW